MMTKSKGNTLYCRGVTTNHEGKKVNMGMTKLVVHVAHCVYLILLYEHQTDKCEDSTHCHRYNTANSKRRTINCEVKKEYFEHDATNHGCIRHHYEHSKLNYKSKAASTDDHRPNSRQPTTNFDYGS